MPGFGLSQRASQRGSTTTIINTGGGGGPNPTDAFSLNIKAADTVAVQVDAGTLLLRLSQADGNATPTDALSLNIKGLGDASSPPTDGFTSLVRVWLSGSAGSSNVTSPGNANGANDGAVATLTTALAGAATATMTSQLGSNIGSLVYTSARFRGWFKSVNTLVTSTTTLVAHSSSALFSDVTIFANSGLNATVDNLSGAFTFDLTAAGVNTLAKLQSLQLVCTTTDAVAGVTPAVLTVDAAAVDLVGVF